MPNAVRIIRDIPYGQARIGYAGGAGPMQTITLAMDAYLPDPAPAQPAPALLLAFGGAFHRGSKENDAFPTAGSYGPNTAMAEYCQRFAAEGIACFSVNYRLAPQDPDPGSTPVLTNRGAVSLSRIAVVREIMGLPPTTQDAMADVVEAAIDDVTAAARALHARAAEFGIDPTRLVLGGWSAGGRCAFYAAYAERVPCVGVLALSGSMGVEDIAAYLPPGQPHPPTLLLVAEGDLPAMREAAGPMMAALRETGCDAHQVTVLGRDHWYAAEANTDAGMTVQQVMRDALRRWVGV